MAMPTYDELFQPVLSSLSDNEVHTAEEIRNYVSSKLSLTDEELNEVLPRGVQTKFSNRVAWAKTSLIKAGLVEKISYGKNKITEEGLKVYRSGCKVDFDFLMNYDGFKNYQNESRNSKNSVIKPTTNNIQLTPDEGLENTLKEINNNLEDELLSEIKNNDPAFFERLVVNLLENIYKGDFKENSEVTGKSGDEGIDGIIKQDRLGFNNIYIQAKKWENDVSRPEIQKFAGALQGQGAMNGAFITSSNFTKEAYKYVEKIGTNTHIVLINGKQLAKLMIEYNVGVNVKMTLEVKKVDQEYFHPEN